MKKILSVVIATAMLISCFVLDVTAFAVDTQELTVGTSVTITMPKNGTEEDENKYAKFVPTEDGWYTFTCDTEYVNMSAPDGEDIAGGVMAIDLYADDYSATQSLIFFFDTSSLTDEEKSEIEESGIDIEHIGTLKFTANLEAGETYYIVGYQDSTDDFTTAITVEKHEHTVSTVERTKESDLPAGMYETCDEWYCHYDELVTPYTIEYKVIKGANQTVKKGEALTVTADGSYDKFICLYVDDEQISSDDYTVEEGSTIVTLSADYLDTLEAGKHTLTFEYMDGKAETEFTIAGTDATATSETKKNDSKTSPSTGADSSIAALSAVVAGGVALAVVLKKKNED